VDEISSISGITTYIHQTCAVTLMYTYMHSQSHLHSSIGECFGVFAPK
jgi:hypothetical protein